MKRQKTQCTTQPLSRPPKHTHTFDISKAADFQLSFGIEVNISMEPFHPSSQVNGCYFNLLRSTLGGGGTKKNLYGKALPKVQPLTLFVYILVFSFVLPREIPTLSYNWSLRKAPLQSPSREYPPHVSTLLFPHQKGSTLMLHFYH